MINIVIPMAGFGSRFSAEGYALPKPLIPAQGVPMIELVVSNLRPNMPHKFIFICQRMHIVDYGLDRLLKKVGGSNSEIIPIDGVTQGAACTVLCAESLIDNSEMLMIANCDQYVTVEIDDYIEKLTMNDCHGLIMTMKADDPKWSYVGFSEKGEINEVVEKKVISDEATVGIYNFKLGSDFVSSAKQMIANFDMTNDEFYVAPTYNYLISNGKNIVHFNVGSEFDGMYGLGIPGDLDKFNSLPCLP